MSSFPVIDARKQERVTAEQARFFRENGLLLIRNVLGPAELSALQSQTQPWIDRAVALTPQADQPGHVPAEPDFRYQLHAPTQRYTPFRIEYIIDKTAAGKALLGHPFILGSIEELQGPSFVPTWDSMVFKSAGQGATIPWHRDAAPYQSTQVDQDVAAINVDFYLDGSDMSNCLWGILGSNRWSHQEAVARIAQLNAGQFHTDGATPIPVNPGDVLLHSILVLHGSPPAATKLRRVIYYEFRPIPVELAHGPHTPEYVPAKQKLLQACLRDRQRTAYGAAEKPFVYRPAAGAAPPALDADEQLATFRLPHEQYWRKAAAVAT